MQDVFVRVWQRAAEYEEERGRVFSWLVIMARNRALDRFRANTSRAVTAEKLAFTPEIKPLSLISNPSSNLKQKERLQSDQAALRELPENQRQVLLLSFFDGFSQAEIAALTQRLRSRRSNRK